MKFKKAKKKTWTSSVIDLTPLIDVVFLLLLFFLLTAAPKKDPTLSVHLPKAAHGAINHHAKSLTIVLKKDGNIYLGKLQVSLIDIQKMLMKISKTAPNTRIILKGDKKSSYQSFIKILETVNSANLTLSVAVENKN